MSAEARYVRAQVRIYVRFWGAVVVAALLLPWTLATARRLDA